MLEDIKRKAKNFQKPLLHLSIDEHTGEAGFVTRLEAFCDMLFRNKRAKITRNIEQNINEDTKTFDSLNDILTLKK